MLRLNHANLPVAQVAELRDFFVRFFGFTQAGARVKDAFVILTGQDGFVLNLMKAGENEQFPKNFHVGFLVDSAELVRAKHAELRDAGVDVGEIELLKRGGPTSVTFYCYAPNGVLIEMSSAA